MEERLVLLEYHPKRIKEMGIWIKDAVDMYQNQEIEKADFSHFINHYARNYGYLLFAYDYELQKSIQNIIGKKRMKIVYSVLEPQQLQIC